MICAFGSMLQPGGETATAGEDAGAAAAAKEAHREGGALETSSDVAAIGDDESKGRAGGIGDESGGGAGGGNRWPRQETLALLQIRSDMDAVFRDSSHKGPLWEEISRKMAEMGYHRSAKKCREKFENVYKYHKRTKDGRASKSDGKTYRFFDQLEALETANSSSPFLPPVEAGAVPIAMAMPPPRPPPPPPAATVVNATPAQPQVITTVISTTQPLFPPVMTAPAIHHMSAAPAVQNINPVNFPNSTSGTPSSSSSTSSDEEVMKGMMRSKRKRKMKGFFEKLTRDVMRKQEELQRKFLEAIEKRENEQRVREEAWKAQEMARLKREHDILVQERSAVAAKDAALMSFLQKLSEQKQIPLPASLLIQSQPPPPPTPTTPAPFMAPFSQAPETNTSTPVAMPAKPQTNGSDPINSGSSSRWPKAEIDALIKLRTSMEHKYQENVPKGALWEEISGEMRKLGYNRNAKRCKEKWENINKYFKKVKENNKRRREDSKTCPYYSQLEALYREKKPKQLPPPPPIMAQPEQQWPLPPPPPQEQDPVSDNMDQDDEEYDDDEDDDELDGGYEIVANNNSASSMGGATAAMETS